MNAAQGIETRVGGRRREKLNDLIAAEDAAFALLQLQNRIGELERENSFLRNCLPAAIVTAPHPLAADQLVAQR